MPYLGQSPSKGDENNFKILDDISSYTLTFDGSDASVVSAANDTITSLSHRFVQGQRVTYTDGSGSAIAGLTDATVYYIIKDDHNTIKLATSASNATNGTAVNITNVGSGSSHTLNVAFDGVNTKFKATHTTGQKTKITRSAQLVISMNGVIQQPHDTATPSTGFGFDLDGTIVFSQAPVSSDVFWAHVLTNNNVTFDISDNDIDRLTGDGSTVSFNLAKSPPDNRNVLVTIDGVVQYPNDPDGTVRAYGVVENVLTFTSAPALGTEIQVRHIGFAGSSSGSGSGGVTSVYGRTGAVVLKSTDNITVNDAAITGNATVTGNISAVDATFSGNLTVQGTTTTLDTQLVEVDKIEVETGSTNVAVAVTHNGTGDLIRLYDGATQVVTVDDTGKVGIGTNNPTNKFEVYGTDAAVTLLNYGQSSGGLAAWTSGRLAFVSSHQNDDLVFGYSNSTLSVGNFVERMRIDNGTGQVGIGTDNPNADLHISSTGPDILLTDSNQAADNRNWILTGANTQILRLQAQNDSYAGGGNLFDFYRSGNNINELRGMNAGNYWLTINNSTKKVGIGTDNPSWPLTVQGSSGTITSTVKNTGGNSKVYVEASVGNTAELELFQAGVGGFSLEVGSDNALMIKDDGSEKLRITSSGVIQISQAAPQVQFIDSDGTNQLTQILQSGNAFYIDLRDNTNDGQLIIRGKGGGTATEKLSITSAGYLKVTNGSTSDFNTIQRASTSNYSGIRIQDADATQRMQIGVAGGTNNIATGSAQHDVVLKSYANLLLATNQTERLRITSDGHVRPGGDVNQDLGANTSYRWRNIYGQTLSLTSYATVGSIVAADPGSAYYAYNNRIGGGLAVAGTTRLFGQVGISTGTATYRLDIGDGVSDPAAGKQFRINASGDYIFALQKQSTPSFSIRNNATSVVHLNTQNSKRLALGVSTGNASGSIEEHVNIIAGGSLIVGSSTFGAAGSFSVGANGSFRQVLASGTAQDTLIGGISGVSNGFQINTDANNATTYKFHNGSQQTATIKSNGYFGTGTTNPVAQFVVSKQNGEGIEYVPGSRTDENDIYHYDRGSNSYISYRTYATKHEFWRAGTTQAVEVTPAGNLKVYGASGLRMSTQDESHSDYVSLQTDNHANTLLGMNLALNYTGASGTHQVKQVNAHGSIGSAGMFIGGNGSDNNSDITFFRNGQGSSAGTTFAQNSWKFRIGSELVTNYNVRHRIRGYFRADTANQNATTSPALATALSYSFGYQEAYSTSGGTWVHPYPDLVLGYHTGVSLGGYPNYGGCRFFADHPSSSSTMIFSVGNGGSGVHVTNTFTAGANKGFRIAHPHPSKKYTHDLVHNAIEAPQMDLIYRGKVDLVGGSATVNIDTKSNMTDGTFVLLNRDVQCFTSNETGWTAVKGSVSGNILTITAQDNSCTDTISWMVVGERQDDKIKSSELTTADGDLITEPLTIEETHM